MSEPINPQYEDETIDLKGLKCPITFVYTKLALEKIESSQILKVILDYIPSFTNVPKSVKIQKLGEIIKEQDLDNERILWIKKS